MATVTIRNLSDEVHRAFRMRAAMHGRSTEAEIRHILESSGRADEVRMIVSDGYIAAIAAARGFVVATRDVAPFRAAGLAVVDPWQTRQ